MWGCVWAWTASKKLKQYMYSAMWVIFMPSTIPAVYVIPVNKPQSSLWLQAVILMVESSTRLKELRGGAPGPCRGWSRRVRRAWCNRSRRRGTGARSGGGTPGWTWQSPACTAARASAAPPPGHRKSMQGDERMRRNMVKSTSSWENNKKLGEAYFSLEINGFQRQNANSGKIKRIPDPEAGSTPKTSYA